MDGRAAAASRSMCPRAQAVGHGAADSGLDSRPGSYCTIHMTGQRGILAWVFAVVLCVGGCDSKPRGQADETMSRSSLEERLSRAVVRDLDIHLENFANAFSALYKACVDQGCEYSNVVVGGDILQSQLNRPIRLSGTMTVLEAYESLAKQIDAQIDGSSGRFVFHDGTYSPAPPVDGPDPFAPSELESPER